MQQSVIKRRKEPTACKYADKARLNSYNNRQELEVHDRQQPNSTRPIKEIKAKKRFETQPKRQSRKTD